MENEDKKSSIIKPDNIRLIQETILNDRLIQQLTAQKVFICQMATPTVLLKDGEEVTIWFDETNHPLLPKINQMIELRIEQIKNSFK
jgi:hypothetical protein